MYRKKHSKAHPKKITLFRSQQYFFHNLSLWTFWGNLYNLHIINSVNTQQLSFIVNLRTSGVKIWWINIEVIKLIAEWNQENEGNTIPRLRSKYLSAIMSFWRRKWVTGVENTDALCNKLSEKRLGKFILQLNMKLFRDVVLNLVFFPYSELNLGLVPQKLSNVQISVRQSFKNFSIKEKMYELPSCGWEIIVEPTTKHQTCFFI